VSNIINPPKDNAPIKTNRDVFPFHHFAQKTSKSGDYYIWYEGETTLKDIIDEILTGPKRPKHECPGITVNRFKQVETQWGWTIKNRYRGLERTTGWFHLDIDDVDPRYVGLCRRVLFDSAPELKIVWTSASGKGVKAIGYDIRLVNLTPAQHRGVYITILHGINARSPFRINFDPAPKACHQPCFINSDPNALLR